VRSAEARTKDPPHTAPRNAIISNIKGSTISGIGATPMKPEEFLRLANNFYNSQGVASDINRIALDVGLWNYITGHQEDLKTKHKVALVFICLNPLYWQYAPQMVAGARQFFLPGHQTDFFFWTDIPVDRKEMAQKTKDALKPYLNIEEPDTALQVENVINSIESLRGKDDINIIPTEASEWPYPTLLRYNLFLGEEERLKEYEYVYYCDIDMQFVGAVGDEILPKDGTCAAQHPMYALRKEYWPPYEPNEESASYIKRPGRVIIEENKPRFMPLYYAGGFQGGTAPKFIEAMKRCKKLIDQDMNKNYIPIWNDETAWNKELSDNPPEIVLTPSYIYPDSLIKEYYEPLWGKSYLPKIITLTKKFSVSKEGGDAVSKMLKEIKPL
jgi:hypothetical protein